MGLGRAGRLDFFVGHTVLVLAGTGSFPWEQRACVQALGLKHKDPKAPLSIRGGKRSPNYHMLRKLCSLQLPRKSQVIFRRGRHSFQVAEFL